MGLYVQGGGREGGRGTECSLLNVRRFDDTSFQPFQYTTSVLVQYLIFLFVILLLLLNTRSI